MVKATATIPPKLLHTIPRSVITMTLLGLGILALYTLSGRLPPGNAKDRRRRLARAQNCRRSDNCT